MIKRDAMAPGLLYLLPVLHDAILMPTLGARLRVPQSAP